MAIDFCYVGMFLPLLSQESPQALNLISAAGTDVVVSLFKHRVMELLQGKGAEKNGRFQGKANSLAKRAEVEALLQEHSRRRAAGEE